jgi:Inner membrane component of T3SS, cytoplasmic domain
VNFKLFIYYCAVCGGWAALLAWGLCYLLGPGNPNVIMSGMGKAIIIGLCLGGLVAAAVGMVDAMLNSVGFQRVQRTLVCAGVGLLGGVIGAALGQALHGAGMPLFFGWIIVGIFIGASIGVFDIILAVMSQGDMKIPMKRTLNGVYGGLLGGFAGGLPFQLLYSLGNPDDPMAPPLPVSKLAIGLVILGLLIGALIALAQVFLKESWVQIDSGRRAGKQMMLNKDETVIGRAEGVDLGLYGEQGIEKQHARIVLANNRYFLEDNGTPGGTFLNGQRIDSRTPLKNGDKIQVGTAVLRFGEKAKR